MKPILLPTMLLFSLACHGQNIMSVLNKMHQIKKGETLEMVAVTYGLTVDDLLRANPEIKKNKLKKGTFLCIPEREKTVDTKIEMATEKPQNKDYETIKVGVMLPLQDKSATAGKMTEMLQGILMAADSVKREGRNIDLHVWDSGKTEDEVRAIIGNGRLLGFNLVIGPADEAQTRILQSYCNEQGIRLLLPFNSSLDTAGYPHQYMATRNALQTTSDAAKSVVERFTSQNYVVVHTGEADQKGKLFAEEVTKELAKWGRTPRILDIEGDTFAYDLAMNKFSENYIVVDNTSLKTLNILTSKLNDFLLENPEYKVRLVGYPEWQTYTSKQLENLYKYNTIIYNSYFFNPLCEGSAIFQKKFQQNFGKPMQVNYPRFAVMGFDMAYYFMHGIATLGDEFEDKQHRLEYAPLQNPMKFTQENENAAFVNRNVMLINFTPEQKIITIE